MQKNSTHSEPTSGGIGPVTAHSGSVLPPVVQSRRINLLRMLLLPLLLAILLIVFIMMGRDRLVQNNYLEGMQELGRQIQQYQAVHKKLPTKQEITAFPIYKRMNLESIQYDETHIISGCPEDTILAYTNPIRLRFRKSGLAALSVGGKVDWIDQEELKRRLEVRERYYNQKIIP